MTVVLKLPHSKKARNIFASAHSVLNDDMHGAVGISYEDLVDRALI